MKSILPLISAFVIFFSAIIILFTPLRPKLSFVTPELKLISTPTPTTVLPDISTWKTYTSQQYGFKIKYPKNYIYTPCTSYCAGDGLSPPLDRTRTDDYYFSMIISSPEKLPKNTDFNTWMDKKIEDTFNKDAITNDVVTTVNNYLTRKITVNIVNSEDFYYITDNNSVIEIRVGANKTNSEIENNISQILSTFKFTP